MATKFTQNEISTCSCTENNSTLENKFLSTLCATEDVQVRFLNAPVPLEIKQTRADVNSYPTLSRISLFNPVNTEIGHLPVDAVSKIATSFDPMGPDEIPGKATRPILLPETKVNLDRLEHSVSGLKRFKGFPLSMLITNTYFLEPCLYPPIYCCPYPNDVITICVRFFCR